MVVWDRMVIDSALTCIFEILNHSTRKEIESRIRNSIGLVKSNSKASRDLVDEELDNILCRFDLEKLLPKIAENAYNSYIAIVNSHSNGSAINGDAKTFLMWQTFRQSIMQSIHAQVCNRFKSRIKSTLTDPSLYADPNISFKSYLTNETLSNLMNKGYATQKLNFDLYPVYERLSVMDFEGKFTDLSGVNPAFNCTHIIITKKDSSKILHNPINILYSIPYQLNRDCSLNLQATTSITVLSINSKFNIKSHKDPDNVTAFIVVSKNNNPINIGVDGNSFAISNSLILVKGIEYGISIDDSNAYLLVAFILSFNNK